MAQIRIELMSCIDCLNLIANGEVGDRDDLNREIIENLGRKLARYLCVGDSEKDEEFSWRPCACCGNHLAGSRHELVVVF